MPRSGLKRELVSKRAWSAKIPVRRPPLPAVGSGGEILWTGYYVESITYARGEKAAKRMLKRLRQGKSLTEDVSRGLMQCWSLSCVLGFVDPIDKVVDPLVYRGSNVTPQSADRDDL
jgi:hypothetical protein